MGHVCVCGGGGHDGRTVFQKESLASMEPSFLLAIILLLPCLYDLLPCLSIALPSSPFFYFLLPSVCSSAHPLWPSLPFPFSCSLFLSGSPSNHLRHCFSFMRGTTFNSVMPSFSFPGFFLSLLPNLFLFPIWREVSRKFFFHRKVRAASGNSNYLTYPRHVAHAVFACIWKPTGYTRRVLTKAPTDSLHIELVGSFLALCMTEHPCCYFLACVCSAPSASNASLLAPICF